jgi:hypothetical protein
MGVACIRIRISEVARVVAGVGVTLAGTGEGTSVGGASGAKVDVGLGTEVGASRGTEVGVGGSRRGGAAVGERAASGRAGAADVGVARGSFATGDAVGVGFGGFVGTGDFVATGEGVTFGAAAAGGGAPPALRATAAFPAAASRAKSYVSFQCTIFLLSAPVSKFAPDLCPAPVSFASVTT